jgi:hypothetical protein
MKRRSATKTGKMRGAAPAKGGGRYEDDPDTYISGAQLFNEGFSDLNIRIQVLKDIYKINLNNKEDRVKLSSIIAYYNTQRSYTTQRRNGGPAPRPASSPKAEIFERVLIDITLMCFNSLDLFPNINFTKRPDIYVEELRKTDEILSVFIPHLDLIMRWKNFNNFYNSFLENRKEFFDAAFEKSERLPGAAPAPLIPMGRRRENMDLRNLLVILKLRHERLRGKIAPEENDAPLVADNV